MQLFNIKNHIIIGTAQLGTNYGIANKIENISSYIKSHGLNVDIEIDGGINYETGKLCTDAGANILVAGSFLFKQENLIEATNQLYDFFNS